MDLMSLVIRIGADISKAEKGIADVKKSMDDAAKHSDSFGSKLAGAFKVAATGAAALGAAVVAAGATIMKLATNAADTADRIDKMSQKIGISRQSFQELDYVMSQSGASIESMQIGMKSLRSNMSAATKGGKEQAATFKRLGVSIKDANGKMRSQEDVMFDTLVALQNVDDETERATLATELFGKAGLELMPMLNDTSVSIDDMRKRAHELGLVMDDDAVDAGVKLGDTLDDVKKSFSAIVTKIGVEFFPLVQTVLDFILEHMPFIQTVLHGFFGALGGLVSGAVNIFKWLGEQADKLFGGVWETVSGWVGDVVQGVKDFWDRITSAFKTSEDAGDFWANLLTGGKVTQIINYSFDQFADTFLKPAIAKLLKAVFGSDEAAEEVTQAIKDIVNWFDQAVQDVSQFFTDLWNDLEPFRQFIVDGLQAAWEGLVKYWTEDFPAAVSAMWDTLKAWWDEVITPFAEYIGGVFSDMWKDLAEYWETELGPKLQALWDALTGFGEFLQGAFTDAWNAIMSLFGGEDGVEGSVGSVSDVFKTLWNDWLKPIAEWLGSTFKTALEGIETALSGIIDFITGVFSGDWEKAWNGITEIFSGIIQHMLAPFKDIINGIIDGVNWLIDKVESAVNSVVDGINNHVKIHIAPIDIFGQRVFNGLDWGANLQRVNWGHVDKWLAGGGVLREGQRGVVGEYQPEYLSVVNGQAVVKPMTSKPGRFGGDMNVTFNITQQPGQSAADLAHEIQREFIRMEREGRTIYA